MSDVPPSDALRPAVFSRLLLRALSAAEGRRGRRKRNTVPDAVGLGMKHELLARVVALDPAPSDFEGTLLSEAVAKGGGALAMAREIFDEWRLALESPSFRAWLEGGAPSDDAGA